VPGARLGDLEYLGLSFIEQRFGIPPKRIQRIGGNLVSRRHQLPQHRTLANDLRVTPDIGGRWGIRRKFAEIGEATGLIALPGRIESFGNGNDIRRFGVFQQLADLPENPPVLVAIEIAVRDQIADPVPGLIVEQQAAEHRLLGLDGVRWHTKLVEC